MKQTSESFYSTVLLYWPKAEEEYGATESDWAQHETKVFL